MKYLMMFLIALSFGWTSAAHAAIPGVHGPSFTLSAKQARITTPDGHNLLIWGYAANGGAAQYPGPTLIVHQGETVTITLINEDLPMPVSMVFPGQLDVSATGGSAGLLMREAPPGGALPVTYTFRADHPGTYLYHSGTRPELQVEMGLFGAIIVRPHMANHAYDHMSTMYDHEYLLMLSEMDPRIHQLVDTGRMSEIDNNDYWPVLWFINGRNSPDTMADPMVPWLPHQPYSALVRMHPGEKVLMRVINAGRDLHPFHTHGNNFTMIATDGRLLESAPGMGADLAFSDFTIKAVPGTTYDALFEWTGKELGWDIYGHAEGDALQPNEYAADHGKPLPVVLPDPLSLTFGEHYSGSPFLGALGGLPPGEGGMNMNGGLFFMWHSHAEKELTNDDVFPGGMMTMLIVEPPWAPIEDGHSGIVKPVLGRKRGSR